MAYTPKKRKVEITHTAVGISANAPGVGLNVDIKSDPLVSDPSSGGYVANIQTPATVMAAPPTQTAVISEATASKQSIAEWEDTYIVTEHPIRSDRHIGFDDLFFRLITEVASIIAIETARPLLDEISSGDDAPVFDTVKGIIEISATLDAMVFAAAKTLADETVAIESVALHPNKGLLSESAASDAMLFAPNKGAIDSPSLAELLAFAIDYNLTDTAQAISILAVLLSKPLSDSATVMDIPTLRPNKSLLENSTYAEPDYFQEDYHKSYYLSDLPPIFDSGKGLVQPVVPMELMVFDAENHIDDIEVPEDILALHPSIMPSVDAISTSEGTVFIAEKDVIETLGAILFVDGYVAPGYGPDSGLIEIVNIAANPTLQVQELFSSDAHAVLASPSKDETVLTSEVVSRIIEKILSDVVTVMDSVGLEFTDLTAGRALNETSATSDYKLIDVFNNYLSSALAAEIVETVSEKILSDENTASEYTAAFTSKILEESVRYTIDAYFAEDYIISTVYEEIVAKAVNRVMEVDAADAEDAVAILSSPNYSDAITSSEVMLRASGKYSEEEILTTDTIDSFDMHKRMTEISGYCIEDFFGERYVTSGFSDDTPEIFMYRPVQDATGLAGTEHFYCVLQSYFDELYLGHDEPSYVAITATSYVYNFQQSYFAESYTASGYVCGIN